MMGKYIIIIITGSENCTFLVANATQNFALVTRISQLVASRRLTTLFHAMKTIALILSQIDQN